MVLSDWEGPWVIADHAFEIIKRGVPNGEKLFARLSEYDDYLAYIQKREDYEPGDTLSLIVPFLVAYGLTSDFLVDVAGDNANFLPGSKEAINVLKRFKYPLRIVSTSYCQYVHYTAGIVGIPPQHIRCTLLAIDRYFRRVKERDKTYIKKKVESIVNQPILGISASSKKEDLSSEAVQAINDLDRFFWKELPETSFKEVMDEVRPLGGRRKLDALKEFLQKERANLRACVTVGDSITDWVMLREAKNEGGLAVSFNGNDYAVSNANLAIISYTPMIMPLIVDLFSRNGISAIEAIANSWSPMALRDSVRKGRINSSIFEEFARFVGPEKNNFPSVVWITKDNLSKTIRESKEFRKLVRGVAIGSLG